ncbi:MAG: sugar ABC transporter permease [Peptococcaceae bacterium]|jgi:raffinose/stachyose/melibiose transport system permease protein|nr:sugar ABC transporter permease [Peptococcaceae bacterium]
MVLSLKRNKNAIFLVLPAVLVSMSVVLVPAIMTFYTSLTNWNGFTADMEFIGLENFRYLFNNKYFWTALTNNIIWTFLFLTIPVVIGMGAALLILNRKRGRDALQVVFLLPYVLSSIVNALIWKNVIYAPLSGVVAWLNNTFGLGIPALLTTRGTALFAVAGVDIWHYWGFLCIVYFAALRQVPTDQVEAAKLDGANFFQQFRYVYYPHIRPTFLLLSIMIIIFSFLAFDYVKLLTEGGPAHATEMLGTLAYTLAFKEFKLGRASAAALFMSLFGLIASGIYIKINQSEERY